MTGSEDSVDEDVAQERLLGLLYLCPAAIIKFDLAGLIELMNPLAIQLLMPIAPAGAIENFFELFSIVAPELREMVVRFESRVGRICDEHRVLAAIGARAATRTLVLSVTMQKVDDVSFIAVVSDVTSAASREELVRLNSSRMRAAFDGVRDYSICTVDQSGKVTSWNRSAERLDGYRADEIVGTSADILVALSGVAHSGFASYFNEARRAGFHEFETWRVRKDGKRYWASVAVAVLREQTDDEAIIGYSIVTRDITEQRRSQDELKHLVVTDPLTGALNRRGLFETALREEERLRASGGNLALLMLDVDHFKDVNDRYGHGFGDAVLKQIVLRAQMEIRSIDAIGRYGGEEFAILLPGSDIGGATVVAERIRSRICQSLFEMPTGAISISVSIGVAQTTSGSSDIANLIKAADAALYVAKKRGRNQVSVD